jgi:glycosyltransferase involved in cell wall biosynthesis
VNEWPSLDVIIPAAHAAETLGRSIDAVKAQDYPNLASIVVAAYDDETAAVANEHGAVVVANPSGRTPTGLNLALAAASSTIVARVDAHAAIPDGYLRRAVLTLVESGADNVGGMQVPVGTSGWEKAIAAAMASPLGAGDARYRVGGEAGPVETVYLGVFLRTTVDRLGGYNEDFERTQDYELNHRIRESGGTVWFDPALKVVYRPRGTLRALARQYFDYGRWKREFGRRHPKSLRWRQLAAPLLVALLMPAIVVGLWWPPAWLVPGAYLATLVILGLSMLPRLGTPALGVPLALATMHLSWGLGFMSR